MRFARWFAVAALIVFPPKLNAQSPRTAVTGAPMILGREIPRFVLMEPIRINRAVPGLTNRDRMDRLIGQLLPGQFVPVSEDAAGVYYQAARGFQSEGQTSSRPAGLYVSKTRAHIMFPYSGEARDLNAALLVDPQRLAPAEMAKLKIGAVVGAAKK